MEIYWLITNCLCDSKQFKLAIRRLDERTFIGIRIRIIRLRTGGRNEQIMLRFQLFILVLAIKPYGPPTGPLGHKYWYKDKFSAARSVHLFPACYRHASLIMHESVNRARGAQTFQWWVYFWLRGFGSTQMAGCVDSELLRWPVQTKEDNILNNTVDCSSMSSVLSDLHRCLSLAFFQKQTVFAHELNGVMVDCKSADCCYGWMKLFIWMIAQLQCNGTKCPKIP